MLEVLYLKGSQRKGVIVTVRNTTIEQREGYRLESFEVFGGVSMFAKELARKSDKAVLQVAEQLDSVVPLIVAAFQEDKNKGREAVKQAIADYVK